jgi:hypothetical protein
MKYHTSYLQCRSTVLLLLFAVTSYCQPVINSFFPTAAPVGSPITIFGSGFDPIPANNIVFFGAIKASVIIASATSLTVNVPAGANYKPISVTTANLTGYSRQPFSVTFPGTGILNANTLSIYDNYTKGATVAGITASDLDGDGKADLIFTNTSSTINVMRNTSTGTVISFDTIQTFITNAGSNGLAAADFDGDGKPDLAVSNAFASILSVLRNTSTPGTISFATKIDLLADMGQSDIGVSDIDGDGKPDIAVSNQTLNKFSVMRNTTSGGILSFDPKIDFATSTRPRSIALGDLNDDGKPDAITANLNSNLMSTFKNISIPGTISFDTRVDVYSDQSYGCAIGDMDMDGKPDVAVTNTSFNQVALLRNTSSSGGNITFDLKVNFSALGPLQAILLADLTGDGKPELVAGNAAGTLSSIQVFKNQSTPGNFSLDQPMYYATGNVVTRLAACDWDGDGIIDLALTKTTQASVFKNRINEPYITSFSPVFGNDGTAMTITGSNFTGATSITIGGNPVASFTVVSATQINATVGTAAKGTVAVTTPAGVHSLNEFTLPPPVISSFNPVSGPPGTIVTISGTNFDAGSTGNNIVHFGSAKASILSATSTTLTVLAPAGATAEPITVISHDLAAASNKPFMYTFAGGGAFTNQTFNQRVDFTTGNIGASTANVFAGDIDGDGKPEVLTANYGSNTVSVLRNLSTPGRVAMAPKVDLATNGSPRFVALRDLDNDGKQDMVVATSTSLVSVFKNISTPGSISFAPRIDYGGFAIPVGISFGDYNNDGKTDISVAISGGVAFLRNNSTQPGTISFSGHPANGSSQLSFRIQSGDLDGDGKQEILDVEGANGNFPTTFRNTGTNGDWGFTFSPYTFYFGSMTSTYGVVLPDLDGDNKPDVAIVNGVGSPLPHIAVFKNNSTPGAYSFTAGTSAQIGFSLFGLAANDLNGDGLPELLTTRYNNNGIPILRNQSTPGNINLPTLFELNIGIGPADVTTADIDKDGKPDVITLNPSVNTLSILRNRTGEPGRSVLCPPAASTTLATSLTGSTYQWQVNTGGGFGNISDNSFYSGTTTGTLSLNNIPSAWYGYTYRCLVDGTPDDETRIIFQNVWTGAINNDWENTGNWSCGTLPDANTDVIITGGTVIVNASTTIRTLSVLPGATVTVTTGVTLTVLY